MYCLPPKEIPKKWEFDFTYGGRVDAKNFYWQDGGWGGNWQVCKKWNCQKSEN